MSQLKVDTITDEAGSGAPDFPNGLTSDSITVDGTGAIKVPVGTEAQRPTPATGQLRFNSDAGTFEGYDGTAWAALGASNVLGVPYDYQEFTSSGTWTKPGTAQSGDRVIVQVVGGGGAGGRDTSSSKGVDAGYGGSGGGGVIYQFGDIDGLGSTESIVVGSGGAGRNTDGSGSAGGTSSFGSTGSDTYLFATGGSGGLSGGGGIGESQTGGRAGFYSSTPYIHWDIYTGDFDTSDGSGLDITYDITLGANGSRKSAGEINSAIYGGGAGGTANLDTSSTFAGTGSMFAGRGGAGALSGTAEAGEFPGGGGGGVTAGTSGAGGAGVVRVWCIRDS